MVFRKSFFSDVCIGHAILAFQSLLKSVNIEGSGKRLSITLVPIVGLVLLLGSRETLTILIHARVLKFNHRADAGLMLAESSSTANMFLFSDYVY